MLQEYQVRTQLNKTNAFIISVRMPLNEANVFAMSRKNAAK